jgi:hypothetical protein
MFLAWFGVCLFILIMVWASWCLTDIADTHKIQQFRLQAAGVFPFLLPVAFIGIPFMISGAVKANPPYLWLACFLIGLAYISLVIVYLVIISQSNIKEPLWILFFSGIPGYISLIMGYGFKKMEAEEKASHQPKPVK